jgi:catechol 2,3-dioxygenase-like lactoylglutathione lyase family enzyme
MAVMRAEAEVRIAGVSLTAADAETLAAFYQMLGFERRGEERRSGPAFAALMRLRDAAARVIRLTLGAERLELLEFETPGRPYPRHAASNDPRFQHFAIVVPSIDAAHERLQASRAWSPITRSEPQRLPQSSGGVVAFKFHDPEGHPLELLEFPQERMPAVWRARQDGSRALHGRAGTGLGIDHSAIVVADTARSLEFYARLGFRRSGGSCNRGPEQARLDDLEQPVVEVTALSSSAEPPHLELLCYREPAAREPPDLPLASNDIAATRVLLEVKEGPSGTDDGARAPAPRLIHDPDGHALVVASHA